MVRQLVIFLFCLSLAANFHSVRAESTSAPIKIGAVLALTGPAARWGVDAKRSMELAVDDLKSTNPDKQIVLVFEDSGTQAARGTAAFNKLVELDKVQAVVGDVWTHLTLPLIPIAARTKTVLISPSVVPASVADPQSHFFTLGFKPEKARAAIERFFDLHQRVKAVSVICWDDPWGDVYTRVWLEILQQRGIKVLGKLCTNDYGHEYRMEAAKVALQNPDALLMAYHQERILKLLAERHFATPSLNTSNILEVLRNGLLPWDRAQAAFYTDWPPTVDFERKFQRRFGELPSAEGFNGYDALMALVQAIERNNTDILAGLKTVKRPGLAGPIDFSHGFAANDSEASLMKVAGSEVRRVGP